MKSQSPTAMVALAIVFATALALCVALLCMALFQDEPTEPNPDFTDAETAEGSNATDDTSAPLLPETPGALRYLSAGDGTCTLISVGSCTDACVVIPEFSPSGDRVVAIADRAFYGASSVTAVQIPSTVKEIGSLVFAACNNLVYISVSPQNTAYCDLDGVLYTADLRVLLQYPPMRAGNTVYIDAVTVEIAQMAFYQCAYLERVAFHGSAAKWEEMHIGSKNYSLIAAAKSFDGDVALS